MMANVESAINVVICVHGRADLLGRTLDSFAQIDRPQGFEQLWVIENGSDCGAAQVCRRYSASLPVRYVHLAEKGKSRALQYALDTIGSGLIVFTDDDVRFDRGWLTAHAMAAAEHGHNAFFGGPLLVDYEKPPPHWLLPELPPSARGWQLNDPDAPITTGCFLGANYSAFVERVQQVGGFYAHLGIGSSGNPVGEETEIQQRLLADGARAVYVPDARLWHWVPRKRANPRWALRRQERLWFTNAMTGVTAYEGKPLWGAPRWMWRRAVVLWLRAKLAWFVPDPQRRFQMQKPYFQWRGILRGVRQRPRHRQAVAPPKEAAHG